MSDVESEEQLMLTSIVASLPTGSKAREQYTKNCRMMIELNKEKVKETEKALQKALYEVAELERQHQGDGSSTKGIFARHRVRDLQYQLEGWLKWVERWETWFEEAENWPTNLDEDGS